MRFSRPITQSITSVSVVALGCVGAQVTPDLMLIAGIAGAAGLVSLAFAIFDERRLERERAEQGRRIDSLVNSVNEMIGNREVPIHLRDLTVLSTRALKHLAAEEVARLRGFEAKKANAMLRFHRVPGFSSCGPAEKAITWDNENRKMGELIGQLSADFLENYRLSGKAVWEELKRRLPDAPPPPFDIIAFQSQTIAGPAAAGEAADDIARLARMLPDD